LVKGTFQEARLRHELGHLSLTVAVLERAVFAYAKRIRQPEIRLTPIVEQKAARSPNSDSSFGSSEAEKPDLSVSVDEVAGSNFIWKHPGAVLSLLDMMTECLDKLTKSLTVFHSESSLTSFLRVHRRSLFKVGGFSLVILSVRFLLSRKRSPTSSRFKCIQLLVLFLSATLAHKWWVDRRLSRIRELHHRLLTLLRFWQLCMSELQNGCKLSVNSPPSPVTSPSQKRKKFDPRNPSESPRNSSVQIPISRWMLDIVGVANIWYDYIFDTDRELWFLWYTYSILYSSVALWYRACGNSIKWYGSPIAFLASIYFAMRPSLAAHTTAELLSSIYSVSDESSRSYRRNSGLSSLKLKQLKQGFKFYDDLITDSKRKWAWLWSKIGLGVSDSLFKIRDKLAWSWPLRWCCFYWVSVMGIGSPSTGFISDKDSSDDLSKSVKTMMTIIKPSCIRKSSVCAPSNHVVFFVHGGGWVANFLNSDLTFLRVWSDECGITIVLFDYSLHRSTSFSYSSALATCKHAYDLLCRNQIGLGLIPEKITLAGDSVGARIAVALCSDLITEGSNFIPHSMILAYPPLDLGLMSSPSRAVFMMDPIVPMSLLNQDGDWALPVLTSEPRESSSIDTSFSPLSSPMGVISKFPRTSLMVGSMDPFLDDSVDFAHRLHAAGVFCQLKVFQNLPHGFLGFQTMLPKARSGVLLGAKWISEILNENADG
jgi:acetyl esterase/lipase